jgi:hypothetical protein
MNEHTKSHQNHDKKSKLLAARKAKSSFAPLGGLFVTRGKGDSKSVKGSQNNFS